MTDITNPEVKLLLYYAIASDPGEFTPSKIVRKIKNPELKRTLEQNRVLNFRTKGKALYLSANDATWGWVEEHLGESFPGGGQAALFFLNALREKFALYAKRHGIRLADLFAEPVESEKDPSDLVREACLALTAGQYDVRVRLRDLRPRLPAMSRDEQDRIFLEMQREGWLALMANDDPQDRDAAEEAASLVIADRRRDLVYLHRNQRS
jgi:hypothetical protein